LFTPISVKETRNKSKQMLEVFECDYNSDLISLKKHGAKRQTARLILEVNTKKPSKKKKYISYLRIDIRNLMTEDSSSLLMTDEFKKDLNGKTIRYLSP
jgi:hypothetical protein